MYKVSPKFRTIVYSGGAIYKALLTIGSKQIEPRYIKSIKIIDPIIDTSKEFMYLGTFISKKIEIYFKNALDLDLKDKVHLEIGSFIDGNYEYVPIGDFNIETSPEDYFKNAKITALDNAVLFKTNLDFSKIVPITAENLLKWICNYYKVELGSYPKVNNNVVINAYDNTLSGKLYISWLAELMGSNAKIGRDGKLYLIPPKNPSGVEIDAKKGMSFVKGELYKISRVVYDNGITKQEFGTNTNNTLNIRNDNLFISGTDDERKTIVKNIYDNVKDFEIWNLAVENYGDISLDSTDIVTYAIDGQKYPTFYDNSLTYEMTIMDKVNVSIPTKQVEETTNNLGGDNETKIRSLKTNVDQANAKLEIVSKQVDKNKSDIAQIVIDNEGIKQDVESIKTISKTVKGVGSVTLENASEGALYKIIIKNVWEELEFYHSQKLKVQYQDGEQEFYIPFFVLEKYQGVENELVIENSKITLIQRIGIDSSGNKYILDKPVYVKRGKIDILLKEGKNIIFMPSFPEAEFEVTYLIKNEYTDVFSSKAELSAELKITSDNINSEVRKKVDSGEVVSTINQSAEQITLIGNRVVIESEFFLLSPLGEIASSGGTIGGWTIEKNRLWCFIKPPYDYQQSDLNRIQAIVKGEIQPTTQDYEKYDVNKDNLIDIRDLNICNKLIVYNLKNSNPGRLIFDTSDWFRPIKILNSSNEILASFGVDGVYTKPL